MRLIDMTMQDGHRVDAHGSHGFTMSPVHPGARVGCATLESGGTIAAHVAPVDQLLVVLAGRVAVSGDDGVEQEIGARQAVLWVAGESHTTRALTPASALVVEGPGVGDHLA